jgi:amino acid permease
MIMRLKTPDRRRFKSKVLEKRKRERETYYSTLSVIIVKIILLVFLSILLSISFRIFYYKFQDSSPIIRYMIPGLVAIFIIWLSYSIFNSIKAIRESSKLKR